MLINVLQISYPANIDKLMPSITVRWPYDLVIELANTGSKNLEDYGIEQSELPHIFDRLYTAEKSRNRKLQGSGLGLAIVRKLIQDMNGNITVNSTPYEKTSFIVTLPKAK